MKVFISWSGQLSKNLAETLKQWLPGVIQAVVPYYSPDDISKGSRWANEISKELEDSKIGIICLTKENLEAPWIMFEAGALSKNIDNSKVCPILFEVDPSDIKGPLVPFQAAKFSKEEVRKVIKMINDELGEISLSSDVLQSVFEMWWPQLTEKVDKILKETRVEKKKTSRSERELLEEILELTRVTTISKDRFFSDKIITIQPSLLSDFVQSYSKLSNDIVHFIEQNDDGIFLETFRSFEKPILSLIDQADSISLSEKRNYKEIVERASLQSKLIYPNKYSLDDLKLKSIHGSRGTKTEEPIK
jgi:hypothetical protein